MGEFVGDAGQLYFEDKRDAMNFAYRLQAEIRSGNYKYQFSIRVGLLAVEDNKSLYRSELVREWGAIDDDEGQEKLLYGPAVYAVEHLESSCATGMIQTNDFQIYQAYYADLMTKATDKTIKMMNPETIHDRHWMLHKPVNAKDIVYVAERSGNLYETEESFEYLRKCPLGKVM